MKYSFVILMLVSWQALCLGQGNESDVQLTHKASATNIKPLMIGDPVPDIELSNVRNWKSKKIKTSDLKGKLVILDFWSRDCIACIKGIPKMDELQEKYKDRIQILLVTYNSYRELESLFQRSKNLKQTNLPIVLADTILHKLFPNEGLPYYVWLDGNAITVAKTWSMHVTSELIEKALNGEKLPKKIMKEETLLDFDSQAPMVTEGGGRQWKHLVYYSMIMKRAGNIQKAISGPIQDPVTKRDLAGSFYLTNTPMLGLYRRAYSMKEGDPVIIEVKNAARYYQPKNSDDYFEWLDNYSFCYEQVLPIEKIQFRKMVLQRDLEQFFGLSAVKEIITRECFIIYRIDSVDRIKSRYTRESTDRDNDSLNNVLKYRHKDINTIIIVLTKDYKYTSDQPVMIDETGYTGRIDIHFTADLSNLELLRQELGKFGLGIKTENRPIECLVLKKNAYWIDPNIKL